MKTNHNPNTNYLLSGKSANQIAQAVNWLDENRTYLDETGHHRKNYFPGEIRVKYSGENMLPMFSAVILSDLIGVDLLKGLVYDTPSFQARTATASDSSEIQFAVTTEPAVADSCFKAVLSGIVPAKIIVRDQAHQFVRPLLDGSGQLESCESSIAKILYKAAGTGEQWAMLQIGSAGAGGGYDGYLKAIYYPKEKQYGLICGFDRENEIAGFCWVNGQRRDVLKSTRVKPKEGFLCISGKIDSDQIGLEIKDQIPGKATGGSDTDYHPIALIKKTGENEHETFSCFQLSRYEFPHLWVFGECEEES